MPAPTTPCASARAESRRGPAVAVLLLAGFMDLMDATIVNVALPSVHDDLEADPSQLEWLVSGYLLAFATVLMSAGRAGDAWGRRRVFLLGVVGFTLTSLLAGLATSADALVALRVAQGACAGAMVPQVLAIIQALFAPRERAVVLGVVGAVTGLAAVAGPLVGGALVTGDPLGWGWRAVFLINVPVGVVLMGATLALVPESRAASRPRLDLAGVVLVMAGVLALVYPLVEGRLLGWPGWVLGLLAVSPLLLAAFVLQQRREERRGRVPLLPPSLLRDQGFAAGLLVQLAFQVGVAGYFLILTLLLQAGLGFSAWDAGLVVASFSVGAFVGSGVGVALTGRLGRRLVVSGGLGQAAGMAWSVEVVVRAGGGLTTADLVPPLALAGVGLGLLVVPLLDLALATVPAADAGAASGTLSTFQQVGAALGVAAAGLVFFRDGHDPGTFHAAFTRAAWVPVAGSVAAALAALWLPARQGAGRRPAAGADLAATPGGA